jgi:flagellar hook-associated protein 1 FlgK
MSLTVALKTAASGLNVAQASLRTVSDNISNVNTPGYVRKEIVQRPLVVNGAGMGVTIEGVRRITDSYLQVASLAAAADAGKNGAIAQYLDNAQGMFGNPSAESFYFNRLDKAYSAFETAANDPTSTLMRGQAIAAIQDFLGETNRINDQLSDLNMTVETKIVADIETINDLLIQINQQNADITRARLQGADSSGSENIQSQMLDELSKLMSVRVVDRENGGVTIRSPEGVLLAGDGAAKLSYVRLDSTPGYISALTAESTVAKPIQVTSGEVRGLLDLRNDFIPGMRDQLGEFASRAVERINAAHNNSVAFPAPETLTGRETGLDVDTAIEGFTGVARMASVNSDGSLIDPPGEIVIDFDNGDVNGTGFTNVADLLAELDALTGGTSDFTDGVMTLDGGGNGIAILDDSSNNAGRGFSHFFGLNDLVRSTGITSYETGLQGTSNHGFSSGTITFQISQADGRPIRQVAFPAPGAGDMNSLVTALNDTSTGVGAYGSFSLNSSGALTFTGSQPLNARISVVTDTTERGVDGPSISQVFGLGILERVDRSNRFKLDADIVASPLKMALGKLDFSEVGVATTPKVIRAGDGRGAMSIASSGEVSLQFQAVGSLGAVQTTVATYAAQFGGSIGRDAEGAETRKEAALSVQAEALTRRQSVEGVNLDEELVNLTTYQQAFNASARMIQAAKDMLDVLVNMV